MNKNESFESSKYKSSYVLDAIRTEGKSKSLRISYPQSSDKDLIEWVLRQRDLLKVPVRRQDIQMKATALTLQGF